MHAGEKDLRAVVRVLCQAQYQIDEIAAELQVDESEIERIKHVYQGDKSDLWYIAIIATWLNGNYDKKKTPYTLHNKEYQHPSWWNLFYAIAKESGGNKYTLVEEIVEEG